MQWTGDRLESVSLVRLEFGHFEGALHPFPHQMPNTSKESADGVCIPGKPGGSQGAILPLKIVFGRTYEIKDLSDGPKNRRINMYIDHLTRFYHFVTFTVCKPGLLIRAVVLALTNLLLMHVRTKNTH